MNKNKCTKPSNKIYYQAKNGEAEAIKLVNDYELKHNAYYLLKKFDWLLFLNYDNQQRVLDVSNERKYNKVLRRYSNFRELRDMILKLDDDLKETYEFLRDLQHFYRTVSYESAPTRLDILISECNNSKVKELNEFGNTLIRWKKEIINSFIVVYTYTKDGEKIEVKMNNGIAENKNRTLKLLKNNSNGYKNWDRFRNRSLYVLNEDETYHLNPIKK